MTRLLRNAALSALSIAIISGCSATANNSDSSTVTNQSASASVPLAMPPQADKPLTLNQIMANPDWMGLLAKNAYWADDSQSVYFNRQQHQSPIADLYQQGVNDEQAQLLGLNQLHLADQKHGVLNADKSKKPTFIKATFL